MKVVISFIADGSKILDTVAALANGNVPVEGIYIEPVQDGETITATRKQAPTKTKHTKAKRKRGRPKANIPDRVITAVRKLQTGSSKGAALEAIKKVVKSPSVSPVISDLIKNRKLLRTASAHYKVA